MTWLWVSLAFLLGLAVTWYLTGRLQQRGDDVPGAPADSAAPVLDDADASAFGGARTPASDSVGPAEAWRRDAEDEDALLARGDDAVAAVPPVAEATPNGDLAGVGDPEAVAAVESESEGEAPTPSDSDERGGPAGVSG